MNSPYDFRKFQQELAALEGKPETKPTAKASGKKALAVERLAKAKEDFIKLKEKYSLTIDEAVNLFSEEDGVGYLRDLISAKADKVKLVKK